MGTTIYNVYRCMRLAFQMSYMCSAEWLIYAELPPTPLYPATRHAHPCFHGTRADISSSLTVWTAVPADPLTHGRQWLHGTSRAKCGKPVKHL